MVRASSTYVKSQFAVSKPPMTGATATQAGALLVSDVPGCAAHS